MFVLWPSTDFGDSLGELGFSSEFHDARVVGIEDGPCAGTADGAGIVCDIVEVRLLQGPDRGDTTEIEFAQEDVSSPSFDTGDRLVLSRQPGADPGFEYAFADRSRKPVLGVLAIVFAAAVVLLGRLRGLAALAGLAASFVVLLR